ncbi:hypothetical protein [Caldimonas caldifontis]|uniref:hypothetical protein n=1 Tax=Caldimonas caldifontis TaxID=1452508 RepID=UPI0014737612|nr:hypothetical protein [Caldimonas caldifontis]
MSTVVGAGALAFIAGPRDVVKLTVLIVDHSEDKQHIFGAELARAFGPGMKPT